MRDMEPHPLPPQKYILAMAGGVLGRDTISARDHVAQN